MNYIKIYTELFKEENFINAAREKRICLFLGSGVGFNIGMPDWAGLAKELAFLLDLDIRDVVRVMILNVITLPLVSFGAIVASGLLPIYKACQKSPVDCIRLNR